MPHVLKPQPTFWMEGSREAVDTAITCYMSKPAPIRLKNGKPTVRKRRFDHRCLVAGTISWPDSLAEINADKLSLERKGALKKWKELTRAWLHKQYQDKLIAICLHEDESHLHFHFFVVGDAQRLHPGMKNELVDDKRMISSADRYIAHRAGLRIWLDDFHREVGLPCGLKRSLGSRPTWRVKSRATYSRLNEIDKQLAERPDHGIQALRDEAWDSEPTHERPRQRY